MRDLVETMVTRIEKNAVLLKNKIAIADYQKQWTFSQLQENVYKAICNLYLSGVERNSKVMLQASGRTEFVAYYYAVHYLGATCIPYSDKSKIEKVNDLKVETNSLIVISEGEYDNIIKMELNKKIVKIIKELYKENVRNNDIADILFTSGTTGKQKGVMHTHTSITQAISNISKAIELVQSDVVLLPLPLHHSFALGTLRTFIFYGATVILVQGLRDIVAIEYLMKKYNCTGLSCSPLVMDWIIRTYKNNCKSIFKNLRYIEIGTAPLTVENRKKIRCYFEDKKIYISFGATEAPRAVYMDINAERKDLSVGNTVGDYEVRIFGEDNISISEHNVPGRLGLKGNALMEGYFEDLEQTETCMNQGFFLTGDVACIDADGYITLMGRTSDLIIIGGEKVYPKEIEDVMLTIPGIIESVCLGINAENGMLGQRIVAFIQVDDSFNLTEYDIKNFLHSRLENYKIPYKVFLLEELPRNEMGKINRNILQSKLSEGY